MNARTPSEIRDAAIERFDSVAASKFDAGQKEHGGNLDLRVQWEDLEYEVMDLWFYIQSMKRKCSLLAEENEALRRECGKLRSSLKGED
jgi:hypothetical protein